MNAASINYLTNDLRELNARLPAAFAQSADLPGDELRTCRWLALGMQSDDANLSTWQRAFVEELQGFARFARSCGLEDVIYTLTDQRLVMDPVSSSKGED